MVWTTCFFSLLTLVLQWFRPRYNVHLQLLHCQGHQCWRGRSEWAITSTCTRVPHGARLIEDKALPDEGHLGLKTPGGIRNDLTREIQEPDFWHFATDAAGTRLISDTGPMDQRGGWLWRN